MIEYRKAKPGDAPAIRSFLEKVWYATYTGLLPVPVIQKGIEKWFAISFLAKQAEDPELFFLLAIEADEIIGLTTARMLDAETMNIARLYIHPDYQGRGLGSLLMQKAMESLTGSFQKIRLGVIQGNQKAISFYQHKGFIQTGSETEDIAGYPLVVLIMEKRNI
jgi:ribosomal protein S18 acetylase RimI-like enzyme